MIGGPPVGATSNALADWLELEAFVSESGSAPTRAVNQSLEMAEDYEPLELDDENQLMERRLAQVCSAVHERTRVIGTSYPFALDTQGVSLSLKTSIDEGGSTYLFCLIVSSAADSGPLSGKGPWAPDVEEARRLFQICATVASAGFSEGPAFSVGWPRLDSSGFLEKLAQVYALYGDGVPYRKIPSGAPPMVKDDAIDVIAWKDTNGVKPPMGYFLGQAASGANWLEKSLKGLTRRFHGTWFEVEPAAEGTVGTLMPFYLASPADADPTDHASQEEIAGQLRRHHITHSELLHRHRVSRFVSRGVELAAKGVGPIENIDELKQVSEWVNAYREQLRKACES